VRFSKRKNRKKGDYENCEEPDLASSRCLENHITCGGGLGGFGCGGVVLWDRTSRFSASILDLKQARQDVEIRASATGKVGFFAVFIIPLLPILSFTESHACADLGEGIARFLTGEHTPASFHANVFLNRYFPEALSTPRPPQLERVPV